MSITENGVFFASRKTMRVKQTIVEILDDNLIELRNRMRSLSDSDFVKYYIQLSNFVVPILKSIDTNSNYYK